MRDVLKNVGFDVIYQENANLEKIENSVKIFLSKLGENTVGLFYFSGHGTQIEGYNYLIPIESDINDISEINNKAYNIGLLLDDMRSTGNSLNIIILDACRDNPFKGLKIHYNGLANILAPKSSLIAFATEPGKTASDSGKNNGIYTMYLKRYITTPGLKIEDMFKHVRSAVANITHDKQIPWENTSLVGDFCFAGCKDTSITYQSFPFDTKSNYKGKNISINGIIYLGNTVLKYDVLEAISDPYLNRNIDGNDLEDLRFSITRQYIKNGYISSGAIIENQAIINGDLRIKMIEGRLVDVKVSGGGWLESFIQSRLLGDREEIFNSNELSDRFQGLLENPFIDKMNGTIKPGLHPGDAILDVHVELVNPFSGSSNSD